MTLRYERTWSLYCGQVRTGSDRFGQVRTGVKRYFSSTVSRTLSKFCPPLKPACGFLTVPCLKPYATLQSGGNNALSRFNWCKVWTGVKCNFSWEHFQKRYIIRKLSLSRVRMWNFTRIGPKTKKLWLSIIPALRRSYQPRLGQPPKGVNCNFSWPHLDKSYVVRKLSISEAQMCSFSMIGQKIKNYSS